MKHLMNRKGFTLVELLGVLSILGFVLAMIYGLLLFGINVFTMTSSDYTIQSDVRLAMEKTNRLVRFSSALFAVPGVEFMDPEWSYIGLSEDHTEIINYTWDSVLNTHREEIMVGPYPDITFSIGFEKENNLSKDNSIQMFFESYNGNGTAQRYNIRSGYEALNSLQVIDYGTKTNPATALAYRTDQYSFENFKIIVNIALVLDNSGSMGWGLVNPSAAVSSSNPSRISVLKEQSQLIVEQFATNTNKDVSINFALVPFATYAKTPSSFYDVKVASEKASLISLLDGISANGNTNTGDGLRRAYYELRNKQDSQLAQSLTDTRIQNYTIILVDGESNMSSLSNSSSTSTDWGCTNWYRGTCTKEGYVTTTTWNQYYYTDNGTIRNCTFTPTSTSCTPGYVNSTSQANTYVALTGALLKDSNFVSNYLVSFATSVSKTEIVYIADSTNTPEDRVFYATDANQLGLSFTEIQMSITNDLWQILGPKLGPGAVQ